jgi:hypothetical protein
MRKNQNTESKKLKINPAKYDIVISETEIKNSYVIVEKIRNTIEDTKSKF